MNKLWAVAAVVPLLASCAASPAQTPEPPLTTPVVATTPAASATPDITTPSPVPTPEAPATPEIPKIGYHYWKDPETPPPLPELTAAQQEKFGACLNTVISPGTKGSCAELVQRELKELGLYESKVTQRATTAATNAVLRYQRSRNIKPTGNVSEQTWYALASGQPARPETIPDACKIDGVVLCVDQGHDKLRYMKNGEVLRTVRIRTGGYTNDAKTGKWRVFPTVNGFYQVFNKHQNPRSSTYGSGAMPYSIMFDPNMYVHYSTPFARQGYASSSHGCVNVASLDDIKWLYNNTPVGAYVHVY